MVGSSNEISRESCQFNRQPRIDRYLAMRNVAPTRFQAPSASDQAEEENETMIAGDLFTAPEWTTKAPRIFRRMKSEKSVTFTGKSSKLIARGRCVESGFPSRVAPRVALWEFQPFVIASSRRRL
jgi:hypothetical protein